MRILVWRPQRQKPFQGQTTAEKVSTKAKTNGIHPVAPYEAVGLVGMVERAAGQPIFGQLCIPCNEYRLSADAGRGRGQGL